MRPAASDVTAYLTEKEFSEVRGEFFRNSSPIASVVALYNSAGLITPSSLEEVAFVSRIPLLLSTIDVVGRG
jgi:hypothetical protein